MGLKSRSAVPSSETVAAAIKAKDTALVRSLFERGADPNAKVSGVGDCDRAPLLHVAVSTGSADMVGLLLDRGADIEGAAEEDRLWGDTDYTLAAGTALIFACSRRDRALAELLLDCGARIDAADDRKYQALHHAALNDDVEMTQMLLARGADPNRPGNGDSALFLAAWFGHLEVAKLLLERGAKTTYTGEHGAAKNIFNIARRRGHKALANLIRRHTR